MVAQLPGFQGNAPIALKDVLGDENMTDNGLGTAWIDALDPVYGQARGGGGVVGSRGLLRDWGW